ncbi:hypothetical protein [Methanosphaera sp.]|uniref:hypothetical protein n=1 Tax=Methanosphaera sp. TaxID=2666342 RepID=UPI0025D3F7AE|nr:hypothetical protein [Methanosphaera sp.]
MKNDSQYIVVKEIPLKEGGSIRVNTDIYRMHGNYYMDGGLLPPAYQQDFDQLIENEEKNGWKYLRPNNKIVGKNVI